MKIQIVLVLIMIMLTTCLTPINGELIFSLPEKSFSQIGEKKSKGK